MNVFKKLYFVLKASFCIHYAGAYSLEQNKNARVQAAVHGDTGYLMRSVFVLQKCHDLFAPNAADLCFLLRDVT